MTIKYWKLNQEPFSTSPDPRFLYRGEMHQEALDRLIASVTLQRGITAIVGEPGLGKSTLIRTMLYGMQDSVNIAWAFNTTMSAKDLLKYVARDFGLKPKSDDKSELLMELYTFLIREHEAGRIPVLIVDESQNLSVEALEEIRQLSNLETTNKKLIQVILAGQPQLDDYLESPELVQLKQRIALKARLDRLGMEDTKAYIRHRLNVAGAEERELFSEAALKAVAQVSDGVPRVINQICDNALLTAAQRKAEQVDAVLIHELVEKGVVMHVKPKPAPKQKPVVLEEFSRKQPAAKKVKPQPKKKEAVIDKTDSNFGFIDISELISVL